MAKYQKKLIAIELRKKGLSINAIAKKLDISKGTVSLWCKDMKLTEEQKNVLKQNTIKAGHKGRSLGTEKQKKKKLDIVNFYNNLAEKDVGALSNRDFLLIAAALYWGEGSKTSNRFIFVNSDPNMIKCMYIFLTEVLKIDKNDIRPTIQINEIHRPRIDKVLTFWHILLQLPLSSFNKPYYVKTPQRKVYANYDSYYGVLRLKILKGSRIQYRILGLIKALCRGSSMVEQSFHKRQDMGSTPILDTISDNDLVY